MWLLFVEANKMWHQYTLYEYLQTKTKFSKAELISNGLKAVRPEP